KHAKVFLIHGLPLDIGVYDLEPPARVYIDPRCADQLRANTHILRERELVEPLMHKITIFTKSLGPLSSFSTSRYSQKCNTRYYHNFMFILMPKCEPTIRNFPNLSKPLSDFSSKMISANYLRQKWSCLGLPPLTVPGSTTQACRI
ncbi:hypothetical protein CPB83DRAFT_924709, partial [Crepidotus variabilis]